MFKRPRIHSLGVHGIDSVQLKYVPKSNSIEIVLACDDGMISEFTLYVYGDGAMPTVHADWVDQEAPSLELEDEELLEAQARFEESAYGRFEYDTRPMPPEV